MNYALSGRVVTMDDTFRVIERGVVYVRGRDLAGVLDQSAPAPAGFEQVQPIAAHGTIFPGLIDLHNHLSYNLLPQWQVDRRYTNRNQWSGTPHYRSRVTGPMTVIGNQPDLLPSLTRYVECKCLLAGVTITQGIALFSNLGVRRYYQGVVRNVEHALDPELPDARGHIADVNPKAAAKFLKLQKHNRCVLLHLSEGTDDAARAHFLALRTGGQWAITPSLAGIHCVGLKREDFRVMGDLGASMVWSPTSNLALYGETADVHAARKAGVRIGIGSDWSTSGTRNLLAELRVARAWAGGDLAPRDLVAMATRNGAAILGWDKKLGTLEPGKRADLLVLAGSNPDPYDALLRADEGDVRLVVIDGAPRAGTQGMMRALGVDGEVVRFGDCTRVVSLHDAAADPHVPFVDVGAARHAVRGAMRRLPELAAAQATQPHLLEWRLALDDFPAAPDHYRAQLEPIALDPLTIAGDAGYWPRLRAQPNLPEFVRTRLENEP